MRISVCTTYNDLSEQAADLVAALIAAKPTAVLGLPTGSTPEGMYAALTKRPISFAQVRTFNLDEYLGLGPDHPQSYHQFMKRHLFDHIDLPPASAHIPAGLAPDPDQECARYETLLQQAGGLDLVILGLGENGHVGFNEPGTPWDSRTRRVMLAEKTRQANARFFDSGESVPREALTMGIGTILSARKILLLVAGSNKAAAVRRLLTEPPTVDLPASALHNHANVIVLLDEAAAAGPQ